VRILLVEDERSAARMIAKGLREHGHAVDLCGDGDAALKQARANPYDVIVLDVMLPMKSGLEVCRELRAHENSVPILMLTARDAISDRIAGLDTGADDYLVKPFHFAELVARVRALARRGSLPIATRIVRCGGLALDTHTREARLGGQSVDLTAREYALLEFLCRNEGRVVSRDDIAVHVWDNRYDPCSNVIDVYVQRLRRKLDRSEPSCIRTRRGAGYQFVAASHEPA
jgi:two-component system copper resistance phosphate regulon response regulator CusR